MWSHPLEYSIEAKSKSQVQLELDMYFDELMHAATNTNLEISVDTMHPYVAGLAALKNMMHMLSDELERGAKLEYPDAMKARVWFKKDVTIEHADTIIDYQAWNQFTIVVDHEDVKVLVLPQLSEL